MQQQPPPSYVAHKKYALKRSCLKTLAQQSDLADDYRKLIDQLVRKQSLEPRRVRADPEALPRPAAPRPAAPRPAAPRPAEVAAAAAAAAAAEAAAQAAAAEAAVAAAASAKAAAARTTAEQYRQSLNESVTRLENTKKRRAAAQALIEKMEEQEAVELVAKDNSPAKSKRSTSTDLQKAIVQARESEADEAQVETAEKAVLKEAKSAFDTADAKAAQAEAAAQAAAQAKAAAEVAAAEAEAAARAEAEAEAAARAEAEAAAQAQAQAAAGQPQAAVTEDQYYDATELVSKLYHENVSMVNENTFVIQIIDGYTQTRNLQECIDHTTTVSNKLGNSTSSFAPMLQNVTHFMHSYHEYTQFLVTSLTPADKANTFQGYTEFLQMLLTSWKPTDTTLPAISPLHSLCTQANTFHEQNIKRLSDSRRVQEDYDKIHKFADIYLLNPITEKTQLLEVQQKYNEMRNYLNDEANAFWHDNNRTFIRFLASEFYENTRCRLQDLQINKWIPTTETQINDIIATSLKNIQQCDPTSLDENGIRQWADNLMMEKETAETQLRKSMQNHQYTDLTESESYQRICLFAVEVCKAVVAAEIAKKKQTWLDTNIYRTEEGEPVEDRIRIGKYCSDYLGPLFSVQLAVFGMHYFHASEYYEHLSKLTDVISALRSGKVLNTDTSINSQPTTPNVYYVDIELTNYEKYLSTVLNRRTDFSNENLYKNNNEYVTRLSAIQRNIRPIVFKYQRLAQWYAQPIQDKMRGSPDINYFQSITDSTEDIFYKVFENIKELVLRGNAKSKEDHSQAGKQQDFVDVLNGFLYNVITNTRDNRQSNVIKSYIPQSFNPTAKMTDDDLLTQTIDKFYTFMCSVDEWRNGWVQQTLQETNYHNVENDTSKLFQMINYYHTQKKGEPWLEEAICYRLIDKLLSVEVNSYTREDETIIASLKVQSVVANKIFTAQHELTEVEELTKVDIWEKLLTVYKKSNTLCEKYAISQSEGKWPDCWQKIKSFMTTELGDILNPKNASSQQNKQNFIKMYQNALYRLRWEDFYRQKATTLITSGSKSQITTLLSKAVADLKQYIEDITDDNDVVDTAKKQWTIQNEIETLNGLTTWTEQTTKLFSENDAHEKRLALIKPHFAVTTDWRALSVVVTEGVWTQVARWRTEYELARWRTEYEPAYKELETKDEVVEWLFGRIDWLIEEFWNGLMGPNGPEQVANMQCLAYTAKINDCIAYFNHCNTLAFNEEKMQKTVQWQQDTDAIFRSLFVCYTKCMESRAVMTFPKMLQDERIDLYSKIYRVTNYEGKVLAENTRTLNKRITILPSFFELCKYTLPKTWGGHCDLSNNWAKAWMNTIVNFTDTFSRKDVMLTLQLTEDQYNALLANLLVYKNWSLGKKSSSNDFAEFSAIFPSLMSCFLYYSDTQDKAVLSIQCCYSGRSDVKRQNMGSIQQYYQIVQMHKSVNSKHTTHIGKYNRVLNTPNIAATTQNKFITNLNAKGEEADGNSNGTMAAVDAVDATAKQWVALQKTCRIANNFQFHTFARNKFFLERLLKMNDDLLTTASGENDGDNYKYVLQPPPTKTVCTEEYLRYCNDLEQEVANKISTSWTDQPPTQNPSGYSDFLAGVENKHIITSWDYLNNDNHFILTLWSWINILSISKSFEGTLTLQPELSESIIGCFECITFPDDARTVRTNVLSVLSTGQLPNDQYNGKIQSTKALVWLIYAIWRHVMINIKVTPDYIHQCEGWNILMQKFIMYWDQFFLMVLEINRYQTSEKQYTNKDVCLRILKISKTIGNDELRVMAEQELQMLTKELSQLTETEKTYETRQRTHGPPQQEQAKTQQRAAGQDPRNVKEGNDHETARAVRAAEAAKATRAARDKTRKNVRKTAGVDVGDKKKWIAKKRELMERLRAKIERDDTLNNAFWEYVQRNKTQMGQEKTDLFLIQFIRNVTNGTQPDWITDTEWEQIDTLMTAQSIQQARSRDPSIDQQESSDSGAEEAEAGKAEEAEAEQERSRNRERRVAARSRSPQRQPSAISRDRGRGEEQETEIQSQKQRARSHDPVETRSDMFRSRQLQPPKAAK